MILAHTHTWSRRVWGKIHGWHSTVTTDKSTTSTTSLGSRRLQLRYVTDLEPRIRAVSGIYSTTSNGSRASKADSCQT